VFAWIGSKWVLEGVIALTSKVVIDDVATHNQAGAKRWRLLNKRPSQPWTRLLSATGRRFRLRYTSLMPTLTRSSHKVG